MTALALGVPRDAFDGEWFEVGNCSSVPHEDSVYSRIRAFQWSCVICGLFLAGVVQSAYEIRLKEREAVEVKRPKPRRKSFVDAVDSATATAAGAAPPTDEEADRDFLGIEESKSARGTPDRAAPRDVEGLSRNLAEAAGVDVRHCATPTEIFAELLRTSGGGYIDRRELASLLRDSPKKRDRDDARPRSSATSLFAPAPTSDEDSSLGGDHD